MTLETAIGIVLFALLAIMFIEFLRINKLEKKCKEDDGLLDELSKNVSEQQIEIEAIKARVAKFNRKRFLYLPTKREDDRPEFVQLQEATVKQQPPPKASINKDLEIKTSETIGSGDKMGG